MWWISHIVSFPKHARPTHHCRSHRQNAIHRRVRKFLTTSARRARHTCAAVVARITKHAARVAQLTRHAVAVRRPNGDFAGEPAATRGSRKKDLAQRAGRRIGSPEQIRTAVTALRGRRPRPLDDGAEYLRIRCSGGRTRTPNDRARTCCVADYTTPEGGRHRLADHLPAKSKRSRAAPRRASARSRPSSSIDSNRGSPWWRPSTAA